MESKLNFRNNYITTQKCGRVAAAANSFALEARHGDRSTRLTVEQWQQTAAVARVGAHSRESIYDTRRAVSPGGRYRLPRISEMQEEIQSLGRGQV